MTNYAVLVYEELATGMLTVFSVHEGSMFFEKKKADIQYIEDNPEYKLVSAVGTTNYETFLKACVSAHVAELTAYCSHYQDYFRNTKFSSKELRDVAMKCYLDYERSLMLKVSLQVEMCMLHNVEVESELALACYDYKHRQWNPYTSEKAKVMV